MLTVRDAPRPADRVGVIFGARRLLAAVLLEGRAREGRLPSALLGRRRTDKEETQTCEPRVFQFIGTGSIRPALEPALF